MSPRTQRSLGVRLIRELVMWILAAIFVVIAMTLIYQVLMAVVVPELTNGMSSAPASSLTRTLRA